MMKSSQPRRPYEPDATPATLSSASATDLTCFSSICRWVTTLMDCASAAWEKAITGMAARARHRQDRGMPAMGGRVWKEEGMRNGQSIEEKSVWRGVRRGDKRRK